MPLPGSYHHPPGRRQLLIPQKQHFFKNLFAPSSRKGGGEGDRKLCHTQCEILKTTGKIVHISKDQTKSV